MTANKDDVPLSDAQLARLDYQNHPANVEAEYGVLGSIYLDNEMFAEISEHILSPDDFDDTRNCAIYRAMQTLYERGEPVDYLTVPEELRRTNQVEAAGGIANATHSRYENACISAWRGVDYAKIVADHARKREVLATMQSVVTQVFRSDVNAAQALAAVTEKFQPLIDKLAENDRLDGGIISADELMRLETPEMNWPISGILPEGFALIGAPPKTGKSAMGLQLALSIALGGKALGNAPTQQGDVLYLALEDSPARMKDRIARQMCGEAVPPNLFVMFKSPAMLDGGLIQVESWLRTHPNAQAVFIDTLGRWRGVGSQGDNSNIVAADYQDTARLQALGLKHHVAIVALHHLRKDRVGVDPLESLSGSTGISAPADAVWVLSRERNEEMGELQIIGRDVLEQKMAVKLSGLTLTWQVMGEADDIAVKEGQRKVFEALRSIGAAATPSHIAAYTGEKPGTVKTRLFRMKEEGLLISVDRGRYYFGRQRPSGF